MKKLIFMMFSILLFTAINATTITKVKQEPSYVSPGETFELFLKVENKGSSTSGNVRIGFEENENFKANGNLESFKSLGKIGSNQEPSIISFKIDVGENVLVGTNKLEISVYEGLSSTQSFSTNIDIEVRDENQQLRVQKITTPEIRAGEEGKIQIELYNENSNFLKDIILELKLNEIEDKKISTIGETNEKIVKKISGNEKVVVDFNIIADPSITTKPYQIPIKLTYSDSLGTKIEKEILTTLKIKSEPKIRILKEKKKI